MIRLSAKTVFYLLILFVGSMLVLMFLFLMYFQNMGDAIEFMRGFGSGIRSFLGEFVRTARDIISDIIG